MKTVPLPAELRFETGKGPARRLRAAGRVPAVFYGRKTEAISLSVNEREFRKLLERAGTNPLFDLQIQDGEKANKQTALLKERQVRPVDGTLIHLDFIEIFMDELVEVSIPLHFEGKPVGLEKGGMLQPTVREVLVSCLPGDVPDSITVDTTELDMGHALHIGELILPEGVSTLQDPSIAVVAVVAPKRVEEEVVEEEEELLEEGEEPKGEQEKGESTESSE
jgi:large subunit ribosomal protein L25